MQKPPRKRTDHLVGASMMAVAYGTVGIFETVGAFFAFFWVMDARGFTPGMLHGTGTDWTTTYDKLPPDRQSYWTGKCLENHYYTVTLNNTCTSVGPSDSAETDFYNYRMTVLRLAQSGFLLSVVWGQVSNIFIRKTQIASIFSCDRLFDNKFMLCSVLFEIGLISFLIYTPGVDTVFELKAGEFQWATVSLWIIPFILIWEETRKWWIRTWPRGCVARCTSTL